MWKEAVEFLSKYKLIKPLIKKYGSCKISPLKTSQYFVDLVESIISQQLSGKAAKTIFGRVKNGVGEITPENILKVSDDDFRSFGLSRQKLSYIKDLSQKVNAKTIKIKQLNKLSDEEVIRELVLVKGIGVWTAQMFLMFTLGRADIFPSGDLGIKNGMTKLLKKELNAQEMDKFAKRWKPFRTVASWYIWANLDNR